MTSSEVNVLFAESKSEESDFKKVYEVRVTEEMVEDYAKLTGDYNSIHFNDLAAQMLGFNNRFAHGVLIAGIASKAVLDLFGDGVIPGRLELKFSSPVYVGSTIGIFVRTRREKPGIAIVDVEVRVADEVVVTMNNMMLFMPK